MGGLVKPVVKRFGERAAILAGLLSGAIGVTLYAFADTGALFWFAVPFAALMSLQAPAMQGMMTRLVAPSEQGLLQGATSSINGITGMVGPIIFTQIFAYAIAPERAAPFPGAPFSPGRHDPVVRARPRGLGYTAARGGKPATFRPRRSFLTTTASTFVV
jgi:DHA1 family tetracycline resistance protein-like MFS transporter